MTWQLIFTIAIFTAIAGVFLKLLLIDPRRIKKLFFRLESAGWQRIEPENISSVVDEKIQRWFMLAFSPDVRLTPLRIITKKENGAIKYLADLHLFYFIAGEGINNFWTILIKETVLDINGDFYLHRRLPPSVQKFFDIRDQKTGWLESNQGLEEDFSRLFMVKAKEPSAILPAEWQKKILATVPLFPSRLTSGVFGTIYLSPEGWSIISPRVVKQKQLNELLAAGDKLEGK